MQFDESKIDNVALALLCLTLHDECRTGKGIGRQVLHRLDSLGLIQKPVGRAKSMVFTAMGLEQAETAAMDLFSIDKHRKADNRF